MCEVQPSAFAAFNCLALREFTSDQAVLEPAALCSQVLFRNHKATSISDPNQFKCIVCSDYT